MNYVPDNVFAKILKGGLPCKKVYEDDSVLAFYDVNPVSSTHVLVIPKGEYQSFDDFIINYNSPGDFFKIVRDIAHKLGLEKSGYRLVMNHGPDSGQLVPHFHVHILGGQELGNIA